MWIIYLSSFILNKILYEDNTTGKQFVAVGANSFARLKSSKKFKYYIFFL